MIDNWHELTAKYLTFGNQAVRDLADLDEDDSAYTGTANDVISSFIVTALLAEVRALDPAAADNVADLIETALAGDPEVIGALMLQWGHALNGGHPWRLTEIPEPDATGAIITPEQVAEVNRQALAVLERLHEVDPGRARELHEQWQDEQHPTTAADVIKVGNLTMREHAAANRPQGYAPHTEPRR